jgi:hypothetical protein
MPWLVSWAFSCSRQGNEKIAGHRTWSCDASAALCVPRRRVAACWGSATHRGAPADRVRTPPRTGAMALPSVARTLPRRGTARTPSYLCARGTARARVGVAGRMRGDRAPIRLVGMAERYAYASLVRFGFVLCFVLHTHTYSQRKVVLVCIQELCGCWVYVLYVHTICVCIVLLLTMAGGRRRSTAAAGHMASRPRDTLRHESIERIHR